MDFQGWPEIRWGGQGQTITAAPSNLRQVIHRARPPLKENMTIKQVIRAVLLPPMFQLWSATERRT